MTDAFYDQVMALAGPAILYINTHSGPDVGRYDPDPARKIVVPIADRDLSGDPLLAALPADLGFGPDPTADSEEARLQDACQALTREASRLYFAALPKDQAKAIYATLEDTQGSLTLFGSALSGAEFRDRWTALHDGHPLGEAPDIG